MIKKIFLFFLFSVEIFAQTDTLQKSFFDEIDLLFGVEVGAITSFNTNKLFKGRKQDDILLKTKTTFDIQPIINMQVGLAGYRFTLKANYRGNFFSNGGESYQKNINNEKIFHLFESIQNYGIELTYDVTDFFTCGLHYDKEYRYSNRGEGIVENLTPVILPNGFPLYKQPEFNSYSTFKQIKLVAKYNYEMNYVKILSALNFTLYSKPKNHSVRILVNDIENFGMANYIDNTTYYKNNPFNLQFELGVKFNFPIFPLFRFEYLDFDGLYKVYMYSLNLKFQIP